MLLFGISGSINHGKSTFSSALIGLAPGKSRHFTSFQVIAAVAEAMNKSTHKIPSSRDIAAVNEWLDPLPTILSEEVHAHAKSSQITFTKEDVAKSPEQFSKLFLYLDKLKNDPKLLQYDINESTVETYRPFLQWLGGYLVANVDKSIWYKEVIRRAKAVEKEGAKLCIVDGLRFLHDAEMVRDAGGIVLVIDRPGVAARDTKDPTEIERMSIEPDILIINNGTIEQLKEVAVKILADVKSGHHKSVYPAAV